MKNQIALFTFLIVAIHSFAQTIERVYNDSQSPMILSQVILPIDDGEFLLGLQRGGFLGGWGSFKSTIKKIDSTAELVQEYFSENKKIEQIDIQDLSGGIYFIKISSEYGNVLVKKFMKLDL